MFINILIFGDSVAWGCWDPEKGGWADRLKQYFHKKENRRNIRIYVSNLATGGFNTGKLLDKFEQGKEFVVGDLRKRKNLDILIFAIGVNDAQYTETKDNPDTDIDSFEKNLEKLIKKAGKYTDKIIFIGLFKVDESRTVPQWWNQKFYNTNEDIEKYNSVIEKVSQKNKVMFISMLDLLNKEDLEDGLHPNPQGHQKIFERVNDFLLKNKLVEK